MDPKWCQNVTQDGSFHGTEDGVCGYLSDGVLLLPCPSDLGGQTASGPPPYIQVGPPGSDFRGPGA